MGTIKVTGIPYAIEIKGDKPDKEESQRILKLVEALKDKQEASNPFTPEKMRKVYETNDEDLIAAVERAKEVWEKTQGRDLLKEFGFGEDLPEGLAAIPFVPVDRDDAFILGRGYFWFSHCGTGIRYCSIFNNGEGRLAPYF